MPNPNRTRRPRAGPHASSPQRSFVARSAQRAPARARRAIPTRVTAALQNGEMADSLRPPILPLGWPEPSASRPDPADEPRSAVRDPTRPTVVVRTSSRRRKTAAAFWENDKIVVVMPTHVPEADRPALVEGLVTRVLAKRPKATTSDDALAARAAELADRYVDGVRPASIRWVTNQGTRWGSCSTHTREIRISHRLRIVPGWVLDATIVHELAHLLYADHSTAFRAVADRYPRQHDAHIFLKGYSLGLEAAS